MAKRRKDPIFNKANPFPPLQSLNQQETLAAVPAAPPTTAESHTSATDIVENVTLMPLSTEDADSNLCEYMNHQEIDLHLKFTNPSTWLSLKTLLKMLDDLKPKKLKRPLPRRKELLRHYHLLKEYTLLSQIVYNMCKGNELRSFNPSSETFMTSFKRRKGKVVNVDTINFNDFIYPNQKSTLEINATTRKLSLHAFWYSYNKHLARIEEDENRYCKLLDLNERLYNVVDFELIKNMSLREEGIIPGSDHAYKLSSIILHELIRFPSIVLFHCYITTCAIPFCPQFALPYPLDYPRRPPSHDNKKQVPDQVPSYSTPLILKALRKKKLLHDRRNKIYDYIELNVPLNANLKEPPRFSAQGNAFQDIHNEPPVPYLARGHMLMPHLSMVYIAQRLFTDTILSSPTKRIQSPENKRPLICHFCTSKAHEWSTCPFLQNPMTSQLAFDESITRAPRLWARTTTAAVKPFYGLVPKLKNRSCGANQNKLKSILRSKHIFEISTFDITDPQKKKPQRTFNRIILLPHTEDGVLKRGILQTHQGYNFNVYDLKKFPMSQDLFDWYESKWEEP